MAPSVLAAPPGRIHRQDVSVMEQSVADELPATQALWPAFERRMGLRGRKMFARVDERAGAGRSRCRSNAVARPVTGVTSAAVTSAGTPESWR